MYLSDHMAARNSLAKNKEEWNYDERQYDRIFFGKCGHLYHLRLEHKSAKTSSTVTNFLVRLCSW